jgi:hypothetical protein
MRLRFPLIALAVGGAVFGIAGAVQASIPDAQGVIHGCYSKTSSNVVPPGTLRVVDTGLGEACRANEVSLAWNHKGPPGRRARPGHRGRQGRRARRATLDLPGLRVPPALPGLRDRLGRPARPRMSTSQRCPSPVSRTSPRRRSRR